ncbi:tetratricopeptide repeat protein-like protein 1 [Sporormia fimetaria CBS 119925]|uniref:Tetratricopeptide repeat protein-like protein 1 n=1 Tax=Sporormia fimetaria CBS 119925 TaxID=1340428 RepID=A0A6A6V4K1_9PLEO|nr:tetratricopeptide repeat protein-like protein 1 [Sporormia fimetaria CBS 119925]
MSSSTAPTGFSSYEQPIFPPEEESSLLSQSHAEKASANSTFTTGSYTSALQLYEKALSLCPTYLEYDIAVLHSNISACHLKLSEWKAAVDSATKALDALDRVDPPAPTVVQDITPETKVRIAALQRTGHTLHDVYKLRTKTLLRRAKARRELKTWASLQSAYEDYQALSRPPHQLGSLDARAVREALRELPVHLEEAKNAEMKEMMGKLKNLGNGILKPFGLSTDNFQFVKDEKTGAYSMNMTR